MVWINNHTPLFYVWRNYSSAPNFDGGLTKPPSVSARINDYTCTQIWDVVVSDEAMQDPVLQ